MVKTNLDHEGYGGANLLKYSLLSELVNIYFQEKIKLLSVSILIPLTYSTHYS